MSRRYGLLGAAAGLALIPAAVAAFEGPDAPARETELRVCLRDPGALAPPGAAIADAAAFCGCYADGAARARLWQLENAEANVGEDVRRPVADRTRHLRDELSAKVAAGCLRR